MVSLGQAFCDDGIVSQMMTAPIRSDIGERLRSSSHNDSSTILYVLMIVGLNHCVTDRLDVSHSEFWFLLYCLQCNSITLGYEVGKPYDQSLPCLC